MDPNLPSLAVFLEAPRLGSVKIRLAQEIGDRHALRLYRVMAARVLGSVRAAGLRAIVWFTPADARAEIVDLLRHDLAALWLGDGEPVKRLVEIVHERVPLFCGDAQLAVAVDHRAPGVGLRTARRPAQHLRHVVLEALRRDAVMRLVDARVRVVGGVGVLGPGLGGQIESMKSSMTTAMT